MTAETLTAILRRQAARYGDAIALDYEGRVTSFAALDRNSNMVAAALLADGLRPCARIGYLGKNCDRFFELLLGAAKSGIVMTPIGWRLSLREIMYIVKDASIELLFIGEEFGEVGQELLAAMPYLRLVSVEERVADSHSYVEWRQSSIQEELPPRKPTDPVLQLYTSGTTGTPKGAVLSHENLFALRPLSLAAGLVWDRWCDSDVSLVTMPVAHVSGSLWGLIALYAGAKAIIMPEFDAGRILKAISCANITKVFLVPAAIQAILRHPDVSSSDFSRLRYILYGASPIPLDMLRQAIQVFKCGFVQNYGMTETCGTVIVLPPEDHDPAGNRRMRSAGRAMPGVSIMIVDEALQVVSTGMIGEILIRSPSTMLEYWNRPEASAEALIDGWMRTGDAGYLDDDGYLYVQDRLKDMIISGGENVYPAEVESVLYSHPAVADVAVIGVPDERWGEAVTAVIVPAVDSPNEAEIIAWLRPQLAGYKIPKKLIFAASLPRNASGKILRRELRMPFWVDHDRNIN